MVNESLLHNWFYGNTLVREIAAIGFALVMGALPVGPTVAWLFSDVDPRAGRAAGVVVPFLDAIKAFVPVAIAAHGGGPAIGIAAAFAALVGDCYSPWLRAHSGKGVAVMGGVLVALCLPAAVAFAAVWFVVAIASNFVAAGSVVAMAVTIVSLWFFLGVRGAVLGLGAFVLVSLRHTATLARLGENREPPLWPPPPLPVRPLLVRADREPVQGV